MQYTHAWKAGCKSSFLVGVVRCHRFGMVAASTTGENLDAVTVVTDSFKMADAFTGDRTGCAVAQTNAQRVDISV